MRLDFTLTEHSVVIDINITHNLTEMAQACGLYECLWNPLDNGWTTAGDIIEPLRAGIIKLVDKKDEMMMFNPDNGWGSYDNLLNFARAVLEKCVCHPNAAISISV